MGLLTRDDAGLRAAGYLDRTDEPVALVTRADVVAGAAALALAGVVAAHQWLGLGTPAQEGPSSVADTGEPPAGVVLYAVVQNTEGFRMALPLWEDTLVDVDASRGHNQVEVAGGRVRVREADCSNQVCVDSGWVGYEGGTITCLPHQMVIQVVADPDDAAPLR